MIIILRPVTAFVDVLLLAQARVARLLRVGVEAVSVDVERKGDKVYPRWNVNLAAIPDITEGEVREVIDAIWKFDLRYEAKDRMQGMARRRPGPKAAL